MPKKKRRLSINERIGFLKDPENADVSHLDIKELLHELQVYKIELEMQNEELRTAQHELEESRDKYLSLFETAPVGFFTLDKNGLILEVNEKGASLAGVPRKKLNGSRFQQFIHPDYLPAFHNFFTGPLHSSIKVPEIQLINTGRFVQMEGLFLNSHTAGLICQLALVDVTLRKKQEEQYAIQKLSQQKETLNTILQTQEEERLRIAEALHNGLGQLLYAAKLKLEDVKENKALKKQLQDFLNDAITETRNLSFTLMPTLLKDFGLKVILEETARRFSTEKFHLECKVTGFKTRLPGLQEIAIFRIVQELLNNVLKHSNATEALIHVKKQKENIHIKVKDNGKGFDAARKLQVKSGTGLATVSNRLQLLNGNMNIASECGKGTTVTIVL
ncbi:MAG: domain S-box protein [Bacteroidetes bacterium]|nr:domain S-box protein [Bacteroidota bacterium]